MKKILNGYISWYKKHKILTIAGTLILLIIIVSVATSDTNTQTDNQESNRQTTTEASAEPQQEEKPQEDQKPEVDLAKQTEEGLKKALAIESFTELLTQDSSSLMGYIASFENVNNSTVRVVIQTNLERDEAQQVGRAIFSNAAYDNDNLKDLDVVVVRDTTGVDKANVYRKDVPLLNR